MPPPPRYTIHHHAATGRWHVVDRLVSRVVYSGTTVLSAGRYARDEEDDWRAQCRQWIEQEEQS